MMVSNHQKPAIFFGPQGAPNFVPPLIAIPGLLEIHPGIPPAQFAAEVHPWPPLTAYTKSMSARWMFILFAGCSL